MPCIPRSIPRSIFEQEALLYNIAYSLSEIKIVPMNFDVRDIVFAIALVESLALLIQYNMFSSGYLKRSEFRPLNSRSSPLVLILV